MFRKLLLAALLLPSLAFADIAVEGTPNSDIDSGDTYTPESGSDRLVVWAFGPRLNGTGSDTVTGGTYNSTALTIDANTFRTVGSNAYTSTILHAKDADLPGASSTISATISGGSLADDDGAALTLSGVDQTTPVGDTVTNSAGGITSLSLNGLSVSAGGVVVCVAASNRDLTTPAGYTELMNQPSSTQNPMAAYKLITADGTENVSVALSSSGAASGACAFYSQATASGVAFSSGPTVAAATDGFTVSGTITNENATVYAVACLPGDADATFAQVTAGNCTGGDTAEFSASEAWTADAADSFSLTGTNPLARYKVCVAADGTAGDTGVTCTTANRSADLGQTIQVLTTPSATSFVSQPTDNTGDTDGSTAVITGMTDTSGFAAGMEVTVTAGFPTTGPYVINSVGGSSITLDVVSNSSQSNITVTAEQYFDPAVVAGDIVEGDTAVSCAAGTDAITIDPDGDLSYTAANCGPNLASWDYSIQDASDTVDGLFTSPTDANFVIDDTVFFFNNAPECDLESNESIIVLSVNAAMIAVDMSDFVSEPDGQGVAYSLATQSATQPTGTTLNSGTGSFSGTPTVEDETGANYVVKVSDPGALSCTMAFTVYVVDTWTMPTLTGTSSSGWVSQVQANAPWRTDLSVGVSTQCDNGVAIDNIISQTPIAGEISDPSASVSVVVSSGACPSFDFTGLPLSWEPWVDVLVDPEFREIKRQECNGDGVWASWLPGTNPVPRGSANCQVDVALIRQEADNAAIWARWAPGTANRGSANLQLNVRSALSVDFMPN